MEELQIKYSGDKYVSKTNEMSFWCLYKLRVSVISMELQLYQLGKSSLVYGEKNFILVCTSQICPDE